MQELNGHHLYGPSSLERRMLCPGSARQEKGLPSESGADAEEGHLLHAAVAQMLNVGSLPAELTMEQMEVVGKCISYAHDLNAAELSTEKKLEAIGSFFLPIYDGTADVVLRTAMGIAIIDWKFGRNPVPFASNNVQLAAYALAAMQTYDVDEVEVHVFQPRAHAQSSYKFSNARALLSTIEGVIARCEAHDAPLIPGKPQCDYCKAAKTCPAIHAQFTELVKKTETLPAVAQWSDDELSGFKATLSLIRKKWGFAVDDEIKARLENKERGAQCGAYRLVVSQGRASVKDAQKAYSLVSGTLSAEEFAASCSVQMGKLTDAYAKALQSKTEADGGKITLKDAKTKLKEVLAEVIEQGKETKKLVRVGDLEDLED